jgi:alkylation response protein AidB-like acyl-CoA dehydrogenase
MRFAYTAEQEALRTELRGYYATLLDERTTAELRADPVGPTMRRVVKQMAGDGWLGLGWPVEWGGRGLGPVEQFIFYDETTRAGAPLPVIGVNLVGPTIMDFGTEEQRRRFLPGIVGGEEYWCIGYSEPEAGTDLAALRTRAVRDGDGPDAEYVVTGTKTWTSYPTGADYCWLAVRTGAEADRHRGITLMAAPLDAPGITVDPLPMYNREHDIATVTFDGVRVPAANVIGGENQGWAVITHQLNYERSTIGAPGEALRAYDGVRAWAADTVGADGARVIDRPWVRAHLARCHVTLSTLRLMSWNNTAPATGPAAIAQVSATKVASSEGYLDVLGWLLEILGEAGYPAPGSPGAALHGFVDRLYRHRLNYTFGGGANEVQREIVATMGLGLPRSR